MSYCNTCGHEKICGCNGFKCDDCDKLSSQLKIAISAIEWMDEYINRYAILPISAEEKLHERARQALEQIKKESQNV